MADKKQEPSDENFKKFVKFYDELLNAEKVETSANLSGFNDPRSWLEKSSTKKLAEIVLPTARDENAFTGNADDLMSDFNALNTAVTAYKINTSNNYSAFFKPGENLETTVRGIKPKTLDGLMAVEQKNPLITTTFDKKADAVYQTYMQVQYFNDLEARAKKGPNALKEEEREELVKKVVGTHAKERRKALEKKYEKAPKSRQFYDAMETLAQIDMSRKGFGNKEFDEKVGKAIKIMKEPAEKAYKAKIEENSGKDVYEVFRDGIKKLASGDAGQYKAITERLYDFGKSSK